MSSAALASMTPERLRALGAAMHEVTAPLKDLGPDQKRRWFQGPNYTDLFVDFMCGLLVRWELTFEGHWLAVERAYAATGTTGELGLSGGKPASKLVTRDANASHELIGAARVVLDGLVDAELRDALLELLPDYSPNLR